MADTSIEWTEKTWNPISGCTRVSAGCDRCYAVTMTNRLESMGQAKYSGLTVLNGKGERQFNGQVRTHDDALEIPLRWKKPRKIFVNSMSDLFHKEVPFEFVDKVFAVMALCPHHTFQILTKRPERMAEYMQRDGWRVDNVPVPNMNQTIYAIKNGDTLEFPRIDPSEYAWPLPNVWLGTSVEDQQCADERIPHLLKVPAAVRFLSVEPLLSPVEFSAVPGFNLCGQAGVDLLRNFWVVVGCESGHGAREMKTEWAQSIAAQCLNAGVPFFMKQMKINGKVSGNLSDFPKSLQLRQFPKPV